MDQQQGRAIVLSLLMLALAQTSYIGAMQGWSYSTPELSPEGPPFVAWTFPPPGYSPENMTLEMGTTMTTNTPSVSGGAITSWEISPSLPTGLSFGSTNGSIWGTPTVLQTTAVAYTIWANNSGGSESAQVNITINDEAPGPFEYNPENNTLTNNTYVHLEPDFINITTGNGSSWSAPAGTFMPWASSCLHHVDNGTLYTAATNGTGASPTFYGYGLDNETAWVINGSIFAPGCYKFIGYGGMTSWHGAFSIAYGTSLYFEASEGNWDGLFGYGLENGTVWRESSNELEITSEFTAVLHDVLYFGAYHNSSVGQAMHAHNLSNGTTWLVLNASNGSPIQTYSTYAGGGRASVVGDVFFYPTYINSKFVYWAYNTSNGSASAISSDASSGGGPVLDGVFYYSSGSSYSTHGLYAYNVSNETSWQVHTRWGVGDIHEMDGVLYYGALSTTNSDTSLWAHNPENGTTWEIGGSSQNNGFGFLDAGGTLFYRVHSGTSNERDLWAYEPSNTTAWQVTNVPLNGDTFTSLGNTLYFTSESTSTSGEHDLWAYNTANETTWFVTNISATNWGFTNSGSVHHPDSTSLIFAGDTMYIREGGGMRSHQPASINYQTNTGGNVTTWAINASLPAGLSFGTNNGTIYGTPTEVWTQTSYMVWANNSGGSTVAYLNITVVDEVPTISYSPSTLVLTINNQSSDLPLNATLTGSGTITSWAISPALPSGLSFGTSNGTMWGIPAVLQTTPTTYTIWANNSGGSSSATVIITINDEVPGSFEYIPENNSWTNNSEVHLAPRFIDQTLGNNSIWSVTASGNLLYAGSTFQYIVDDVIYFDATPQGGSAELYGHNTSNSTTWLVADYNSNGGSNPGQYMKPILVGDVLYFSANDGVYGDELTAFNTSNGTMWRVADIASGSSDSTPGQRFRHLMQGSLYFDATDGSFGVEVWAYTLANGTAWRAADIHSGSSGSMPGAMISWVNGSTLYFDAWPGATAGGRELWAYRATNHTAWRVFDLNSGGHSNPGQNMGGLHVGDRVYFDADDGSNGRELWAFSTTNQTAWRAADINAGWDDSTPGGSMKLIVGDTLYFDADDGSTGVELWAHNTLNGSTWRVTDLASGNNDSHPGQFMETEVLVGDTFYFSAKSDTSGYELWAHDTSNHTTWLVDDINSGTGSSNPGMYFSVLLGDTIYFDANDFITGQEVWAHDLSNGSTWQVADLRSGGSGSMPGAYMALVVNGALFFTVSSADLLGTGVVTYLPGGVKNNSNTGGNVTNWAINASLPSGLSFGTNNGTIYGTPTEVWTQTSYMVWANNSGGSSVAYLNITVVDDLPSIAYLSVDITLTNNTASSDLPLVPNVTGNGEITSWAINASLPAGLSFGASNGTLWGTPTALLYRTAYLIWANNSGGSVLLYLNLTVNDQLPSSVAYSPSNLVLTNNTASSDLPLVPSVTGQGEITLWGLNASLPSGLFFDNNNGTIWGTPTQVWPTTAYRLSALNSGGTVYGYFNLTVLHQAPLFTYSSYNLTLVNNTVMPSLATTSVGGDITSWAIAPSLPSGLSFGSLYGTIWGTPTVVQNTTMYTVWGNNSGGSHAVYLNITVVDQVPSLSYAPAHLALRNNTASSDLPLSPTLSGAGDITSWAISGALPSGLFFGASNGTVWGTPSELWSNTTYTVWANNSGGSTNATFSLEVVDEVPSLTYVPSSLSLTNATVSGALPLAPTLTGGGEITSWSIAPSLPAGLSFGANNGTVWGVPLALSPTTTYTVWANNSGGSTNSTLTLVVVARVPNIGYAPSSLSLTNATASTALPLAPSVVGPGAITSWAVHPALPTGLSFGTSNGTVWGTPTVVSPLTTYTVFANNSGGSATTTLSIVVHPRIPSVAYVPSSLVLTVNTTSTSLPMTPVVTGPGAITTWAIHPALPSGLNFGPSNGTVWGVPAVLSSTTTYTVWANNSGDSTAASLTLTVVDEVPSIAYIPPTVVLTNGSAPSAFPLAPTVSGSGAITSWSIAPALPAGLAFGTNNGTIWGTPTEVIDATVFEVTAFVAGGSTATDFTLRVVHRPPVVTIDPSNMSLLVDEVDPRLPLVPTVLDQDGTLTWSISPALPLGLAFDTSTGTVSGVPRQPSPWQVHTITATGPGGSDSVEVSLEVQARVIVLEVEVDLVLVVNQSMAYWQPNVVDGAVEAWSIAPDLPAGMVFNTATGRLSGVPVQASARSTWTLWANGSGVSTSVEVNITVLDDTDGDGRPNALPEGYNGTLIEDLDDDNDGLSDASEAVQGSDPLSADSDADGWGDLDEVLCSTDATDAASVPGDADGDGYCDALEADPDGDGWSSEVEEECGSDPLDPSSKPSDSDGDGLCDALEMLVLRYENATRLLLENESLSLAPTVDGFAPTSWSLNASLPDGLLFNATTGVWSGQVNLSDLNLTALNLSLANVTNVTLAYTVTAVDLAIGRSASTDVTLILVGDFDRDGLPDRSVLGPEGWTATDRDDDNDGAPDDLEEACGSDPRNATSMPVSGARLEDGDCVVASGNDEVLPEPGPSPFTLFLLFWVAVLALFLVHRSREDKDERAARAARKDEEIEAMIKAAQDAEEDADA